MDDRARRYDLFVGFFPSWFHHNKPIISLSPPYGANAFPVNYTTPAGVVRQLACVKLQPWTHAGVLFSSVCLARIELSEILQRGWTALSPVCKGSL